MLRRVLFALVLIGAAFAGGAVINGPGLAWLQRNFALGRSIIVDRNSSHNEPNPASSLKQFPTANTTPVLVQPTRSKAVEPKQEASKPAVAQLAQADPPLLPESPSTPASALAPLPEPNPPEPAAFPSLDPQTRLASLERPESSTSTGSGDWATIRRKMKALGVVRYTLEGEFDGRVRFSCVIPVEGLKAVSHHFEAEGDDEYQAADAALKRVSLWKATASD